jgi:hypothetical protein
MKLIHKLYHFLGGIHFALILIASVALFVIFGTFIESSTQSHRYAAQLTYQNPLFAFLLWGFFINILFSATRRWPFKKKHVPFLITHLGLLMILSGVLAKHYFGLQGTMRITEGSSSDEVMLPHTYAVHVESKNSEKPARYPLGMITTQNEHSPSIRLTEFSPHCTEHLAGWVKGSFAFIGSHPPIPLHCAAQDEGTLPVGGQAKLHHPESYSWDLYALKTSNPAKALSKLYTQHARIAFNDRIKKQTIREMPLEILLKDTSELDLIKTPNLKIGQVTIPLSGGQALLNLHDGPQLGSLPIAIDIIQKPFFAIIQDDANDVYLAASDPYGRIWSQKENQDVLIAYDDGYAGYTTRVEIPLKAYPNGRPEKEEALINQFTQRLKQALVEGTELAPPLQLLLKNNGDLPEIATLFLSQWNDSGRWLYPENIPLPNPLKPLFAELDWSSTSPSIKQGCEWTVKLFDQLTPNLVHNRNLLTALEEHHWPLLEALKKEAAGEETLAYTLLTHQIFAASELRSTQNESENTSPEHQAALLSAFLRAYGIHFSTLLPNPSEQEWDAIVQDYLADEINPSHIVLETLVSPRQKVEPPTKKLEENKPKISLFLTKGKRKQNISLAYDPTGKGMKWPVLDGEFLVRFQPLFKEIPYQVRLRQARQINYANSSQPYSFESDLIVKDKRNHATTEKTISMNNVHETWDGYRFYLSSISPSDESAVKHVQIVVNYDPAKYLLTYPGAFILSCGILLLFIQRPYRRH